VPEQFPRRLAGGAALIAILGLLLAACGGAFGAPTKSAVTSPVPTGPSASGSPTGSSSLSAASQEPDTGGGTTSGDVPDNAVYLTYHNAAQRFSITYVEGWQLTTQKDGVVIRDKDSSESVTVVPPTSDVAGYVKSTDLPTLSSQAGFKLVNQDEVKVGKANVVHLAYHVLSAPDPVTGKQVPSTVDRYYLPGLNGLAIVSLSTPDGVDNVDAFRRMIESFKWE
jgi:hypothetical protein